MYDCGQVLIAGKCRVDETPKGWFISLLEADKLEEIEKGKRSKRDRAERDEEQRRCSCCLTSAMAGVSSSSAYSALQLFLIHPTIVVCQCMHQQPQCASATILTKRDNRKFADIFCTCWNAQIPL